MGLKIDIQIKKKSGQKREDIFRYPPYFNTTITRLDIGVIKFRILIRFRILDVLHVIAITLLRLL